MTNIDSGRLFNFICDVTVLSFELSSTLFFVNLKYGEIIIAFD